MSVFRHLNDESFLQYAFQLYSGIIKFKDLEEDYNELFDDYDDDEYMLDEEDQLDEDFSEIKPDDLVIAYTSSNIVHLNSNSKKELRNYIYNTFFKRGYLIRVLDTDPKNKPENLTKRYYVKVDVYTQILYNISSN